MKEKWILKEHALSSANQPAVPEHSLEPLEKGHRVKLIFISSPLEAEKSMSESLWVEILLVNGDQLLGQLEDDPQKIDGLVRGEMIEFQESNIVEVG